MTCLQNNLYGYINQVSILGKFKRQRITLIRFGITSEVIGFKNELEIKQKHFKMKNKLEETQKVKIIYNILRQIQS